MARVPVIRIGDVLVATAHEGLRDADALALQSDLHQALERTGARGVLIDVSGVETVDSFLGRMLSEIAAGARLLGAHTVVAGMQPPVAITLVELGLELKGIHTTLTPEKGMALLHRLIAGDDRPQPIEQLTPAGASRARRIA
jgi:rsbT antagonist protein RsbS